MSLAKKRSLNPLSSNGDSSSEDDVFVNSRLDVYGDHYDKSHSHSYFLDLHGLDCKMADNLNTKHAISPLFSPRSPTTPRGVNDAIIFTIKFCGKNFGEVGLFEPDISVLDWEGFRMYLFSSLHLENPESFVIYYSDDESDKIPIESEAEYKEALKIAKERSVRHEIFVLDINRINLGFPSLRSLVTSSIRRVNSVGSTVKAIPGPIPEKKDVTTSTSFNSLWDPSELSEDSDGFDMTAMHNIHNSQSITPLNFIIDIDTKNCEIKRITPTKERSWSRFGIKTYKVGYHEYNRRDTTVIGGRPLQHLGQHVTLGKMSTVEGIDRPLSNNSGRKDEVSFYCTFYCHVDQPEKSTNLEVPAIESPIEAKKETIEDQPEMIDDQASAPIWFKSHMQQLKEEISQEISSKINERFEDLVGNFNVLDVEERLRGVIKGYGSDVQERVICCCKGKECRRMPSIDEFVQASRLSMESEDLASQGFWNLDSLREEMEKREKEVLSFMDDLNEKIKSKVNLYNDLEKTLTLSNSPGNRDLDIEERERVLSRIEDLSKRNIEMELHREFVPSTFYRVPSVTKSSDNTATISPGLPPTLTRTRLPWTKSDLSDYKTKFSHDISSVGVRLHGNKQATEEDSRYNRFSDVYRAPKISSFFDWQDSQEHDTKDSSPLPFKVTDVSLDPAASNSPSKSFNAEDYSIPFKLRDELAVEQANSTGANATLSQTENERIINSPDTKAISSIETATETVEYDAKFISDENFPDGAIIQPGIIFPKTWIVMNTGTKPWGPETSLHCINYDASPLVPCQRSLACPHLLPGETGKITVRLSAPNICGSGFVTKWKFAQNKEVFGNMLWCNIRVQQSPSQSKFAPTFPVPHYQPFTREVVTDGVCLQQTNSVIDDKNNHISYDSSCEWLSGSLDPSEHKFEKEHEKGKRDRSSKSFGDIERSASNKELNELLELIAAADGDWDFDNETLKRLAKSLNKMIRKSGSGTQLGNQEECQGITNEAYQHLEDSEEEFQEEVNADKEGVCDDDDSVEYSDEDYSDEDLSDEHYDDGHEVPDEHLEDEQELPDEHLEDEQELLDEHLEDEQELLDEHLEDEQELLDEHYDDHELLDEHYDDDHEIPEEYHEDQQEIPDEHYEDEQDLSAEHYDDDHEPLDEHFEEEQELLDEHFEYEKELLDEHFEDKQELPEEHHEYEQEIPDEQYEDEQEMLDEQYEDEQEIPDEYFEDKQEIPDEHFEDKQEIFDEHFEEEQDRQDQSVEFECFLEKQPIDYKDIGDQNLEERSDVRAIDLEIPHSVEIENDIQSFEKNFPNFVNKDRFNLSDKNIENLEIPDGSEIGDAFECKKTEEINGDESMVEADETCKDQMDNVTMSEVESIGKESEVEEESAGSDDDSDSSESSSESDTQQQLLKATLKSTVAPEESLAAELAAAFDDLSEKASSSKENSASSEEYRKKEPSALQEHFHQNVEVNLDFEIIPHSNSREESPCPATRELSSSQGCPLTFKERHFTISHFPPPNPTTVPDSDDEDSYDGLVFIRPEDVPSSAPETAPGTPSVSEDRPCNQEFPHPSESERSMSCSSLSDFKNADDEDSDNDSLSCSSFSGVDEEDILDVAAAGDNTNETINPFTEKEIFDEGIEQSLPTEDSTSPHSDIVPAAIAEDQLLMDPTHFLKSPDQNQDSGTTSTSPTLRDAIPSSSESCDPPVEEPPADALELTTSEAEEQQD